MAGDIKAEPGLPPRIMIVMPAQWPRALLRAALRETGYDAVGARHLLEIFAAPDESRAPIRLLIMDQDAMGEGDARVLRDLLADFLARHPGAATLLVSRPARPAPDGPWNRVLRRPVSIRELVAAVEAMVPLDPGGAHPLD